jgi:hypothetical protein
VHRQDTDRGQDREGERADDEAGAGQRQRWQAAVGVSRDQEVRGRADHRGQRPGHPGPRQVRSGQQVQDQHQARCGQAGAGEGERAGWLMVANPQPGDYRRRCGVLDEERRRDVHRGHGGEVTELSARDGHDAVHQDLRQLRSQQVPSPAQGCRGERRQYEGGDPDAGEDDRTRAPSGREQSVRQRP